jgi:hypothetical protein
MPGYGDLIPIRSQLNEGEGVADSALEALTKKTLRNGSLFLKQLGLDMIEPGPRELSEKLVEENRLYSGNMLVEKFYNSNPQPGQAKEPNPPELQPGIRREGAAEELAPQI